MGHLVGRVPAQVSEQTESTKSASYFLLHKHQAQTATRCPLSINWGRRMILTYAAYHPLGQGTSR